MVSSRTTFPKRKYLYPKPYVEQSTLNWDSWLVTIIISFTIVGSLLNTSVFVYPSFTAYFLFCLSVSALTLLTGGILIKYKTHKITLNLPAILFMMFGIYVILHGLLFFGTLTTSHYYLTFHCLLFLSCFCIFSIQDSIVSLVFKSAVLIAFLESILCLLQFLKVVDGVNKYFAVTGSWENPNVTAMFLAMCFPIILTFILYKRGNMAKAVIVIGTILILALILLRCRTAIIGASTSALLLISIRYSLLNKVLKNRKAFILMLLMCFGLLFPVFSKMYEFKRESAESRKLIWKVSASMVAEKPIFGYGYGNFEKEYNLFQSNYVARPATSDERKGSGYVYMAYNEILENAVAGGLVGVGLLLAFLTSLLVPLFKSLNTIDTCSSLQPNSDKTLTEIPFISACTGIITFLIMSMVNFTVQAIPAMCLFCIFSAYVAIYSTSTLKTAVPFRLRFHNIKVGIFAITAGVILFAYHIYLVNANLINKKANNLAHAGKLMEAKKLLEPLKSTLANYESFWFNYASVKYATKEYEAASKMLDKAKILSSRPKLYFLAGKCHEQNGDFDKAEENYLKASQMEPYRFRHRNALLELYEKKRDSTKAISTARGIIQLSPKVPSDAVSQYKMRAARSLQSLIGTELRKKKKLVYT